ncbi:hypothetical protein ABFX02_13G063100 [Erythranthe guttata]
MKIQCNVCESAEAMVLCCADEAALCLGCDEKVHSANKLVSKHQRVPLSTSSSQMPNCDICQESAGYFFCLEDRALLCRKCDVAIHTSNSLVSGHQRFLLTGVKVGLEVAESNPPPRNIPSHSHSHSHSNERIARSEVPPPPINKTNAVSSSTNRSLPPVVQARVSDDVSASRLLPPYTGGSATGSSSQWQMDELFELGDGNQIFNFMDNDLCKADSGKLGDSDCSPILRDGDGEFDGDEFMVQVADTYWTVPEMPSPPTASGLHWSKNPRNYADFAAFVPDISSSPLNNRHSNLDISKRRRRF